MRAAILALPLTLLAFTAQASGAQSILLATALGAVLAGEQPCRLSFDKAAIEQYINKRVQANDMQFGSMLQMMVEGQTVQITEMTPATRTAFCVQTARVARANNFIQ